MVQGIRVSINNPNRTEVRTVGIMPKKTSLRVKDLKDVDATHLVNNETLVYDEASDKFIVEDLPVINGGTF